MPCLNALSRHMPCLNNDKLPLIPEQDIHFSFSRKKLTVRSQANFAAASL
jgi:hypothetical protein